MINISNQPYHLPPLSLDNSLHSTLVKLPLSFFAVTYKPEKIREGELLLKCLAKILFGLYFFIP